MGPDIIMTPEQEELLNFNLRWDVAFEKNDVDEISTFMSDDWIIVGSDGITSKSDFLAWIRSGQVIYNRMDADETIINIFGNTGIIVAKGTSAGIYNGKDFSLYEWSMSVFIKSEKGWSCVSTMVTPVKK